MISRRALPGLAVALLWASATGLPQASASMVENPLFGYTHLLGSPFTIPGGRFVLGTEVAFGIADFLQVGSNLVADFSEIYNAYAKVSLLDFPEFALGLNLGWQRFNWSDLDSRSPDQQITSWLPGATAGIALSKQVALFLGGNLNFSEQTITVNGNPVSGYFQGAQIESDISWAYNPHKRSVGNVLSGGVSYDFTYNLVGLGVSHYFKGFKLGLHYYPDATRNKVLPIIAGGAVVDL